MYKLGDIFQDFCDEAKLIEPLSFKRLIETKKISDLHKDVLRRSWRINKEEYKRSCEAILEKYMTHFKSVSYSQRVEFASGRGVSQVCGNKRLKGIFCEGLERTSHLENRNGNPWKRARRSFKDSGIVVTL